MSEIALAQPQRDNTPQVASKNAVSLQRREAHPPELATLPERLFDSVSVSFAEPRLGYDFSRIPALTDRVKQTQPLLRSQPMVQRSPKDGTAGSVSCPTCPEAESTESSTEAVVSFPEPESGTTHAATGSTQESAAPEETPVSGLIVEDLAAEVGSGQMRRSDFLAQLRTEVTREAEAAMVGTGRTTEDCPYLDYWFGYYSRQDSLHLERAIRRYVPETASGTAARDYIPIIAARVRRSVGAWARTGEITGIPEGLSMGLPEMGLLGGVGRLISGIGSFFFKAREGGARGTDDPRDIQKELGEGRPLDGSVRSRMESAFGMDFARVRTHTDTKASALSSDFNARAFTVGEHVAFGPGEYRPETLVGDALIAHELAHVVQQKGTSDAGNPSQESAATGSYTLEADADRSAAGVVAALWGGALGAVREISANVFPGLRSGLRIQRCAGSRRPQVRLPRTVAEMSTLTAWQLGQLSPEALAGVQEAAPVAGNPRPTDYARASRFASAVFGRYGVNYDIDAPRTPIIGREPNTAEMEALDRNLSRLLDLPGVREAISGTGGRGVPRAMGSTTPSLRGRVRIARNQTEYGIKRYQLEMSIVGLAGQNRTELNRNVRDLWTTFSITAGPNAVITDQERRVAIFVGTVAVVRNPAFYNPVDDIIYVAPDSDLTAAAVLDLARHETMHFLGGREQTRSAFVARYGSSRYIPYWSTFEEGMTELLSREAAPEGESLIPTTMSTSTSGRTTVTVTAGPGYDREVAIMRRIMSNPDVGRTALLRAYFSGDIPERIFELLESEIGERPMIQRFPDNAGTSASLSEVDIRSGLALTDTSEPTTEPPSLRESAASELLVEDAVGELGTGQMRKSEFLSELRVAVCAAADEELSAVGRTAEGCPYIERWIGHYRMQSSQHVERAIRRYAPETAGVTAARDYIPLVTGRVRRAVAVWATTGEIAGVPEELAGQLPGVGVFGTLGRIFSGGVSGIAGAIGGLFGKAQGGELREGDPWAIWAQLGSGRPLEGDVRSRMEPVFGHDFSSVRVHTDSTARTLSTSLNARAFTVGRDVAFASGEYRPGTLIGDALIAHELAHVIQQGEAGSFRSPKQMSEGRNDSLEEEADNSAVGAVVSVWGRVVRGASNVAQDALPQLKSGLRLQRCAATRQITPRPVSIEQPAETACTAEERQSMERFNACCTQPMLREIQSLLSLAIPTVENALSRLTNPEDVSTELWNNFRVRPNDESRLSQIRLIFRSMLNIMQGNRVTFVCRSWFEDPMCATKHASTSPTCITSGQMYMHFCGRYDASAENGRPYLPEDHWLRTMIHEYAHAGCPGDVQIFPSSSEFYKESGPYPQEPGRNVRNADCYAWFAMDVS